MDPLVSLLCHRFIIKIFGSEYFRIFYSANWTCHKVANSLINAIFKKVIYITFFRCVHHSKICKMAIFTHCIYFSTGLFTIICLIFIFTFTAVDCLESTQLYTIWRLQPVRHQSLLASHVRCTISRKPSFKKPSRCSHPPPLEQSYC